MQRKYSFTLTKDHLKLARKMYVDWYDCETGAPAINPKRPYGNSSVAKDVAEIIDTEFSEEKEDELLQLHYEMQNVLQIILSRAGQETLPGKYQDVSKQYHRSDWRRIDD